MKFENSLNPTIKNLKNHINASGTFDLLTQRLRVVTSGYLMDDPNWSSDPHMHDSAELILCTAGKGKTTIFNQQYDIEAGDLILHNPNTPHCERSDPTNPLEFFFVGLTDFKLPNLPENTLISPDSLPVQKTGIYRDQFETFFLELIKETVYRQDHFQYISCAICSCILALVMRLFAWESGNTTPISSHSVRIKDYIDKNFAADLNLSQLSSAVYISQDYMSHIFKAEIGISPMQYLIKKRIAHAKNLLATTKRPISEIATECGYDDPVYFSQIFKRICGCSPRKYRESCKSSDPSHGAV